MNAGLVGFGLGLDGFMLCRVTSEAAQDYPYAVTDLTLYLLACFAFVREHRLALRFLWE
jgi:hypothetical protein